MKFIISREALLAPLSLVAGVIERRHTLPVLANILLVVEDQQLSMTGTDLEVELVGRVMLTEPCQPGSVTVPARKLLDICKSLPDGVVIDIEQAGDHVLVKAERSKFKLTTLPAADFPNIENSPESLEVVLPGQAILSLIEMTSFSMAQQDVRFYLNGMLMDMRAGALHTVATDGHRMAVSSYPIDLSADAERQFIVPRKGVLELMRLIQGKQDESLKVVVGNSHVRVFMQDYIFTSKLVDGQFPDYDRVIPKNNIHQVLVERTTLKGVLSRAAILSNEKLRGIRLLLSPDNLQVRANNTEQEEAEESLTVDYQGETIEIGFNVGYLLDVLNAISADHVILSLYDNNTSALITAQADNPAQYVVMPMHL